MSGMFRFLPLKQVNELLSCFTKFVIGRCQFQKLSVSRNGLIGVGFTVGIAPNIHID